MNLLTDSVFRVESPTSDDVSRVSLPGLLAALGEGRVRSYPGLMRHQEDALHVFLTYLATAVLARDGVDDSVQSEEYWAAGIRRLGGTDDMPWTLVVDDLSQAAFLQSPLPVPDHGKLTLKAETPDALDVLVTAKNHDLKMQRATKPDVDEWVFALISSQTTSGFLGQGNFGISRMNGGFGSRLVMEVQRALDPGWRWRDAVTRLLVHRREVLAGDYGYDPHGLVLVWTDLWDGAEGLPLTSLDPCYLEISRRVRLRRDSLGVLRADAVPSKATRINAKELKGAVGDAWTPVDLSQTADGRKALTVGPAGLTADTVRRLVFADHLGLSPLQRPALGWSGDLWLSVSVLVRGQGLTEGFHEVHLRLPEPVLPRVFGPPAIHDPWVALSKQLIEAAGLMQRALGRGVRTYLAGGPARLKERETSDEWARRWNRRFQSLWTPAYFPQLWAAPDVFTTDDVLAQWAEVLWAAARQTLDEAMAALPQHFGRRYRARVLARQSLWGNALQSFPSLRPVSYGADTSAPPTNEESEANGQRPTDERADPAI